MTKASDVPVMVPSVFGNWVNSVVGLPPRTERAYAKSRASNSVLLLSAAGALADGFIKLRSVVTKARWTMLYRRFSCGFSAVMFCECPASNWLSRSLGVSPSVCASSTPAIWPPRPVIACAHASALPIAPMPSKHGSGGPFAISGSISPSTLSTCALAFAVCHDLSIW